MMSMNKELSQILNCTFHFIVLFSEEADDKQNFNQLLLDYGAKLPINISVQKLLEVSF